MNEVLLKAMAKPNEHFPAQTVMVLGAPRSGTSMTAGILNSFGVWMGNIRSRDSLNPRGYFEDKEFLALGTDIFRAVDSKSNGFRPPPIEAVGGQRDKFDERIGQLVAQRNRSSQGKPWGWKATTACFYADFFLPHVCNPHIVVVLRNPVHSANSAVRYVRHQLKKQMYNELSVVEALQVLGRYQAATYDFLARHPELPSLILAYEDIVADPNRAITSLAAFLDMPVSKAQIRSGRNFVASSRAIKTLGWTADLRRGTQQKTRRLLRKLKT